jgi:hypothetical protein
MRVDAHAFAARMKRGGFGAEGKGRGGAVVGRGPEMQYSSPGTPATALKRSMCSVAAWTLMVLSPLSSRLVLGCRCSREYRCEPRRFFMRDGSAFANAACVV